MNPRLITGVAILMLAAASAEAADRITVPAGTSMRVRLGSNVGSDISSAQDVIRGRLAEPVVVNGRTVLPSGSQLTGVVVDAKEAGKVKGRGRISLRFTSVTSGRTDEDYRISTRTWTKIAPSGKEKDAATIALPAAGGAIIGGITGGGKGAAVGAAIGGGAGTAVVLSTRGKDVRLGEGHVIIVRLNEAVVIEQ
ncbi:MAG: hypothetical protein IT177_01850 [Acidobacteria bacterium]|nr:hypothetical protein [Acidobacteriota bacterium]